MALAKTDPPSSPLLMAALDYAARSIPVFPLHNVTPSGRCSCGDGRCIKNKAKHPRTAHGFKDATTDAHQIRAWWKQWPAANIGIPTGPDGSGWLVVDIDTRHGATYDGLAAQGNLPKTMTAQSGSGGVHLVFRYPRGVALDQGNNKLGTGYDVKGAGGYIVAAPSRHASGGQYEWVNDLEPAPLPTWILKRLTAIPEPKPIRKVGARREVTQGDKDDRDAYWLAWALAQSGPGTGDTTGYKLAQQLYLDPQVRDMDGTLTEYARRATLDAGDPFDERDVDRWLKSASGSRMVSRGQPAKAQKPKHERPRAQVAPKLAERPPLYAVPPMQPPDDGGDEPPGPPPPEKPDHKRENRTDMGNARRFVARHGPNVRYVAAWEKWLVWDGHHWKHDETGDVARKAKETAISIWDEVSSYEDENDRREHAKHAARSESDSRLRAMLNVASTEPEIATATAQLDKDTWLLNCLNGTVELKTATLRDHLRYDLCTKIAQAEYDAAAQCPTWLAFLHTIFGGDAELIAYVQRAVGYALTGETSEQCVFVLHGGGANGKTTFLDTLARILADYAMTTPTDTLMEKRGQNIPSDVARLMGARFVAASESGDGRRLDEELVKRISGGDKMAARFMHHDWFEFYPVLKLFMAVNHKPTIRGTDNGIWRRIHLWPFEVTIPPAQQDKRLTKKLLAEAPGILAWAVQGCLAWQRDGLNPPAKVLEAVEGYREEMDPFGGFISECCTLKPTALVASKALLDRYKGWCEANGERELSAQRLAAYLREKCGCKADRDTHGNRAWVGISIKYGSES